MSGIACIDMFSTHYTVNERGYAVQGVFRADPDKNIRYHEVQHIRIRSVSRKGGRNGGDYKSVEMNCSLKNGKIKTISLDTFSIEGMAGNAFLDGATQLKVPLVDESGNYPAIPKAEL